MFPRFLVVASLHVTFKAIKWVWFRKKGRGQIFSHAPRAQIFKLAPPLLEALDPPLYCHHTNVWQPTLLHNYMYR